MRQQNPVSLGVDDASEVRVICDTRHSAKLLPSYEVIYHFCITATLRTLRDSAFSAFFCFEWRKSPRDDCR
ncbi:hypothetical protein TNCT_677861 [Trichonephila clavata]|uniref:Uncharacterized protein n=1 Tax=Trichonephila clavata TaxID=2740835 RepID=A0A8X6F5B2_TRICU|nr:hypothetical protein TNCT_677861 [Trichonephila clavata]